MTLCQVPEEILYLRYGTGAGMFAFELLTFLVLFLGIYRVKGIALFFRKLLIYLAGNFMLGGVFGVMKEYPLGQRIMDYGSRHAVLFYAVLVLFVCFVELLLVVMQKQRRLSDYEIMVEVWLEGQHFYLRGYMDSGNMLTDDVTNRPVVVGCYGAFETHLSEEHQYIINDFFEKGGLENDALQAYHTEKIRWMVCNSVGVTGHRLPLLMVDKIRYVINKRVVEYAWQPVLLFDGELMAGAYDVLLNKDL